MTSLISLDTAYGSRRLAELEGEVVVVSLGREVVAVGRGLGVVVVVVAVVVLVGGVVAVAATDDDVKLYLCRVVRAPVPCT